MTAHPSRPTFRHDAEPIQPFGRGGEFTPVLDLRALLGSLRRQKAWLILPPLVAVVCALLLFPLLPTRYQASTQLLIDPRGLQVVDKELAPGAQNSEASLPIVESQLKVITSERVLRELIARERLQTDPEFIEPTGLVTTVLRTANRLLGVEEKSEDPTLRALRTVQRRVGARRSERSYIIDIFFEASTPQKAVRLANALADVYLESEFAARTDVARRVEQSLSGRLSELRDQVRKAEERVEVYKAENDIVGASGRLINEQQLSELNQQLGAAKARTAELKARTNQIERARRSGDPSSIPEAIQSPTIAQMRSTYLDIKRRQSDVMTLLGARHPDVTTLEAQARMARGQIREELDRISTAAWTDYERAVAREQALSRNFDTLKSDTLSTNRAFVRLRELEREAESSRSVYESFMRRTKEIGEQQAVDSANARVISRAVPPREPNGLSLPFVLILALIAGGGAGILIAWLRDVLRRRPPQRPAGPLRAPV